MHLPSISHSRGIQDASIQIFFDVITPFITRQKKLPDDSHLKSDARAFRPQKLLVIRSIFIRFVQ